ncbi:urea ABC transporter substrate-binding protein [Treponema sp. UBA3813]|uniref:urea ABC transporter substrate-binding protein n=1 Tax=Treponema sp. UBA3813 TaxID=1947715 RepID=UPI0025DFB702|nr:urea ABC transporter substrate-binding protein [Treponema sp. UBA3813]
MKKTINGIITTVLAAGAVLGTLTLSSCEKKEESKTVKVGILHSLSGTMAISETSVRDAELLAINEINAAGGVLGKQIQVIQEDGASEPQIFAERARKLIQNDKVATIFGCWTSASRKAVKPVVEETGALLWYPVQYEGMEASPNIMYMGAAPNQQAVPAVEFCASQFGKNIFLVGSDYVFPRTANKIIKAQLANIGGSVAGEEYTPMGHTDFATIVSKIQAAKPDCIINTLNGDSNVAFFKQLTDAGITSSSIPVMSFSIAEEEVGGVGIENLEGHYVAWNYYQTTKTAENTAFVSAYKKAYGEKRVTDDPIEAGYIGVYLWAKAAEKAGSFDVEKIRAAANGISFDAPEGKVTLDGDNQHIYKPVRIGKINKSGLIDEVWATPGAVKPDPYLSSYDWAKGL